MTNSSNFYIGVISEVPESSERELKIVKVDIPGVISGATAYPKCSELDEAKIGDSVLVLDIDPVFHSYFIYEKLKENEFIGFRSSGKMVSITPDDIKISVYDKDAFYLDSEEPDREFIKAQITIDNDGNVSIESSGTVGIYGKSNSDPATIVFGNRLQPGEPSDEIIDRIGGPFVTSVVNGHPFFSRTIKNVGGKLDE